MQFILILSGLLLAPLPALAGEQTGAEVVARVNGVPIYRKELDESLAIRFNKRKKLGMRTGKMRPEVEYAIQMQVLDQLIDSAVLTQAVMATDGLPDVEEKVDQKILSLAATFGGEKEYGEFLKTKNTSLERKREYYRRSYLAQAYFDKLGLTKPDIPEEEIRRLYEEQKRGFKIPEKVKFSQVYLEIPGDATAKQREEIAGYAREAQRLLSEGQGFDEVVRRLSEKYQGVRISGGDRGYVAKGTLPVKVEEVAFSIPPGKVSDPVESEFGFHVLTVSEKKPATYTPYEKVRDFLLKYLQNERVQANVAEHTRQLRAKAKIEILLEKPAEKGTGDVAGG